VGSVIDITSSNVRGSRRPAVCRPLDVGGVAQGEHDAGAGKANKLVLAGGIGDRALEVDHACRKADTRLAVRA
jgi:hypothetical protein